jgi:hypothetical protein
MNTKIIHLRYCRIVPAADPVAVRSEGIDYRLHFVGQFATGKGYSIERMDGKPIASDLFLWLSIYTGEDALDPFQEVDTRFNWHRGDLSIDAKGLQTFLDAAERAKKRKWPMWQRELFDNALIYFSAAVRSGVNMMPLNLGLFALSLECLGNVKYGKRDKHFTFGDKHFKNLLTKRLAPLKRRDPGRKNDIRAFEKSLERDIEFLNHLRNAFYGHSLLHLKKDRNFLVKQMREWMIRSGHSKKFARLSVQLKRLQKDVVRDSFPLYKLGLRLNRLFIFLAFGFTTSIPFATHDWRFLGDQRNDEPSEFRGLRMTVNISPTAVKPPE